MTPSNEGCHTSLLAPSPHLKNWCGTQAQWIFVTLIKRKIKINFIKHWVPSPPFNNCFGLKFFPEKKNRHQKGRPLNWFQVLFFFPARRRQVTGHLASATLIIRFPLASVCKGSLGFFRSTGLADPWSYFDTTWDPHETPLPFRFVYESAGHQTYQFQSSRVRADSMDWREILEPKNPRGTWSSGL